VSRFQNILVPTDFEASADRAVQVAIALAVSVGARLTFVHVVTRDVLGCSPAEAEELLRDDVSEAEEHGVEAQSLILFGDPIPSILATLAAGETDLVVMGTHGRGAGSRELLGCVAQEVVRRSKIPALTVSNQVRWDDWLDEPEVKPAAAVAAND
jgi:nucleotide-binding universal stress UspA family protein